MNNIPTKCFECGQIKSLYSVYINEGTNKLVQINLKIPQWICLDCWKSAKSRSEGLTNEY